MFQPPAPPQAPLTRRSFVSQTLALGTVVAGPVAARTDAKAPAAPFFHGQMLGPILGHMEADQCMVWLRATGPGEHTLEIRTAGGDATPRQMALEAREADDLCLHWHVRSLQPATRYFYRILTNGKEVAGGPGCAFTTPALPDRPGKVRLAISSCAKEDEGSRAVWKRMEAEKVDAVVLIGDTPYIDSTELEVQTKRHREFAAVPEYQALLAARPCWWTWDDHDFGGNDTAGLLPGKENSRLAYVRHRPQASYGTGKEGIYTSFRRGPVEVFLLDTRWFAMTAPSPVTPSKPTLLGAAQWQWLQEKLLASTAPFKLLACGMIWDDKENQELDDWGSYAHERKALEKFIGEHKISGVVYIGGDIHASRVLRYPTRKTAGYDLVQLIASPIHSSTIPSLNVYHPDLVRSAVEPHVFLVLEVDNTTSPARLHAELVNRHGERVFTYHLDLTQLTCA